MGKKKTVLEWFKAGATPTIVLGGIVLVTIYFQELKQLVFTSVEMRVATEIKTNVKTDDVTLSWKQDTIIKVTDTLSKRTDTMIQQQKGIILHQQKLDTMIYDQNYLLKKTLAYNQERDSIDEIKNAKLILSRNKRVEQNTEMINLLRAIKNDSAQ